MSVTLVLSDDEASVLEDLVREGWNGGEFAATLIARHGIGGGRKRVKFAERAMLALHVARRGASKTVRSTDGAR